MRGEAQSKLLKVPHSHLGLEPLSALVQSASFFPPLCSQFQALCHVLSMMHRTSENILPALEESNWNEKKSQ